MDENKIEYHCVNGTVHLLHPGRYTLFSMSDEYTKFPIISIKDQEMNTYIYNESKVVLKGYGMHPEEIYETCHERINGHHEDFYPNGNIRIRGTFKDGKPTDSIVTFYANGCTKRRIRNYSKKTIIQVFDSSNNLLMYKKICQVRKYPPNYKKTEYYEGGSTKLVERRRNLMVLKKEYYTNRNLKIIQKRRSRTEFYENGQIKTLYTWKRRSTKGMRFEHMHDFETTKISYDLDGYKTEHLEYTNTMNVNPQPFFKPHNAFDVKVWIKYEIENGKSVSKAMETENYVDSSTDNTSPLPSF